MGAYRATVRWRRETPDFAYETYDRGHAIGLGGGQSLAGSSAPEYSGDAAKANPEELLAAALASCHMLTFLAVAAKSRLVVDAYEDEAVAELGKNAAGKLAVTKVTLRPHVTWGGEAPSAERLAGLHDKAHANCFVGNSITAEVVVEPVA